jgi:hypothetical protein
VDRAAPAAASEDMAVAAEDAEAAAYAAIVARRAAEAPRKNRPTASRANSDRRSVYRQSAANNPHACVEYCS